MTQGSHLSWLLSKSSLFLPFHYLSIFTLPLLFLISLSAAFFIFLLSFLPLSLPFSLSLAAGYYEQ